MSFTRNEMRTVEPRKSVSGDRQVFAGRRGVQLYDVTGQPLGTFARARDALAALDALDASS
jgi:hypothetical protein